MNSVDRGVTIARCAAVVILVAGCTTWRVQWVSPETVIRRDQPGAVEVTRVDSSRVVLQDPRIVGDSLVGNVDGDVVNQCHGIGADANQVAFNRCYFFCRKDI